MNAAQPLAFETPPSCDSPQGYRLAASLAHTLLPPRPSLFTLKIPDAALTSLAGVSEPSTIESLQFRSFLRMCHMPRCGWVVQISFPHVRASLALSTAPQRDPSLCQAREGICGPLSSHPLSSHTIAH